MVFLRTALDKMKTIRLAKRMTPARMIFLGFVLLIFLGALILSLPISSASGHGTRFTDALFTATSSVCVTGLVVVDTNTYWSFFGKTVILLLIQIGALGIMSVVTLFSVITGRALGLKQRMALKESISNFSIENIVAVFLRILKITLIVEGAGALLVSFTLIPRFGFWPGLAKSIFHAISAFCNAGFDVFGTAGNQFTSLTGFKNNSLLLLVTAGLIIFGGLGFIVWEDISKNRKLSRLSLHTKIVLVMTVILLTAGTAVYLSFESGGTMGEMSFSEKLLNSFFSSVSTRTAGFNSVSMDDLHPVTGLSTLLLMLIGAAPGSTAGGIKITTVFVLTLTVITFLRGRSDIQVFKRRISADIVSKAVSIFLLGLTMVFVATAVLLANNEGTFFQSLFETVSAFGTVGLSTGITPGLSDVSRYTLMVTMLLGRVGTITVFAAFTSMQRQEHATYRYPEGKITVG